MVKEVLTATILTTGLILSGLVLIDPPAVAEDEPEAPQSPDDTDTSSQGQKHHEGIGGNSGSPSSERQ